ncbi:hypothetical protein Purlil1_2582 [Purpureocillium lilacinum]|uniref:Secondary alcohol dehydrogenase protein n=1 Tax=Purpureocillium lilacinum TaxID=33203 RepID=A0ABR0CB84_PURLI|nr:hypothetical protein Purlil1_2582 [Purpureocillium lilacinum]
MSADTRPISPARFAAALKDLSVGMLHLKVLEIRNSIAHLQYSNDQLRPFADGSATATATATSTASSSGTNAPAAAAAVAAAGEPDQDCVDAIRENEQVIDRMAERIALVRIEVEERGMSWTEFQSKDDLVEEQRKDADDADTDAGGAGGNAAAAAAAAGVNGEAAPPHSAWTDGTFQTGTIRGGEVHFDSQPGRRTDAPTTTATTTTGANGAVPAAAATGGSLSDEQLRRALEERMRDLGGDDDDEGGMHL